MVTLPETLARHADQQPTVVALQSPSQAVTYGELWRTVNVLAQRLRDSGFTRFGLMGDNSIAWVLADLACRLADRVCVPIPGFFSQAQVEHLMARAGLDALLMPVTEADSRYRLDEQVALQPLPATPGALAMPDQTGKITFTSGSTGTPKGVCLAHRHLDATVNALAQRLAPVTLQRHLCVLPLATLLENVAGVYLPLTLGATVMLWPLAELGFKGSSELDLGRLLTVLQDTRPDSMILVPELAAALVRAMELGLLATDSFRFVAVGGARVSPALLQRARALGLPLYEGYGLSECGSVVALNVPGAERAGTVGQPLGHVDIVVGADGDIRVSGNTFLGYLGDETVTEPRLDTGDLGAFDDDGFLRVSGRRKNLLITSFGRNISPEWLESELQQRLGVRQALVFGDGEPNPSALVVTDDRSPEQLREAIGKLNETLPDYARLHRIYVRRTPFTRAEGYLTANGRPVRANLMNDLPKLLANAEFASCSQGRHETPAALLEPTNHNDESQRGKRPMAFFDTLQNETAQARRHVTEAPVMSAIPKGRFDLGSYRYFLSQAYHHVKHTSPLMMACGARIPERLEFVRKALVEYIEEEYGHHEWILNDLAACGEDKDTVRYGEPDLPIKLMVSYLYDLINRGNPMGLFGMVQVLEGTSIDLATPMGKDIQQTLGLPNKAFSYLYSHGELDQDHFEFFRELMDQVTDPDDQQAIIDTAKVCYRLYGDMLHAIPLPAASGQQGDGEVSHAAA